MCSYLIKDLQIKEDPKSNTNIKYGESITLHVSAIGAEHYEWKHIRADGPLSLRHKGNNACEAKEECGKDSLLHI